MASTRMVHFRRAPQCLTAALPFVHLVLGTALWLCAIGLGACGSPHQPEHETDVRLTVQTESGSPVVGATVVLASLRGFNFTGRISETGQLLVPDLDKSTPHILRITPPTNLLLPHVEIGWRPHPQTFILKTSHTLSGLVVSPSGDPVPGVTIEWTPLGSDPPSSSYDGTSPDRSATTDAHGRFFFDSLPSHKGTLVASLSGPGTRYARRTDLTTEPDRFDLVLELDPAPTLTFRLDDPDQLRPGDRPIVVRVKELDPPGRSLEVPVASSIPVTLSALSVGARYQLWARAPARMAYALLQPLSPDDEIHVLTLRRGRLLSGDLTLPPGSTRPLIQLTSETHDLTIDGLVDVGHYRIEGVPDGRWTLAASYLDPDGRTHAKRLTLELSADTVQPISIGSND